MSIIHVLKGSYFSQNGLSNLDFFNLVSGDHKSCENFHFWCNTNWIGIYLTFTYFIRHVKYSMPTSKWTWNFCLLAWTFITFSSYNTTRRKKTEKEKCFSFLSKTRKSTHYIFLNEFHKVYVCLASCSTFFCFWCYIQCDEQCK